MARDEHNKAAEHDEKAAQVHRSAAEHHGKGEHAKGKEQANAAKQHSLPPTLRPGSFQEPTAEVNSKGPGSAGPFRIDAELSLATNLGRTASRHSFLQSLVF
jgi:hypothetical protein